MRAVLGTLHDGLCSVWIINCTYHWWLFTFKVQKHHHRLTVTSLLTQLFSVLNMSLPLNHISQTRRQRTHWEWRLKKRRAQDRRGRCRSLPRSASCRNPDVLSLDVPVPPPLLNPQSGAAHSLPTCLPLLLPTLLSLQIKSCPPTSPPAPHAGSRH
jgi:hypothetical protein